MIIADTIIETNRLFLREFIDSDAHDLFALNNDPLVMQYTGDLPFLDVASALKFVQEYDAYEKTGMGRWAVIRKQDQAFLGWCGLKEHTSYVDIGYRFLRTYWGQGYATEAALACKYYAFDYLHLPKLVGRVAEGNVASVRVLEKLGMTFWKHDTCEGMANASYYQCVP